MFLRAHLSGREAVMPDHQSDIRDRRAESNAAIAARDPDRIIAVMHPDITVVVAGGPTLTGRAAQRDAFAEQFIDPGFRGYLREPDRITVHEPPTLASESGRWVGRWQMGLRREEMRGMYTAEWCLVDDRWYLKSEVYLSGPP
jgi:ketosteroid isomerase-like protein